MITFETITYKNFLGVGENSVTLSLNDVPQTLFTGKNGASKSTMLEGLSYALFNSAYRKVNNPGLINSINKKTMEVQLTFKTSENNEYRIVRGLKPDVFKIFHNGEQLKVVGGKTDLQKELETRILQIDKTSFFHIVVLGSTSYTPFMRLKTPKRREIVESLLGITIFSEMKRVLKEKVDKQSSELDDVRQRIAILTSKISEIQFSKQKLLNWKAEEEEKGQKSLDETETRLAHLQTRIDAFSKDLEDNYPTDLDATLKRLRDGAVEGNSLLAVKRSDLQRLVQDQLFFDSDNEHSSCPKCRQTISDEYREGVVKSTQQEIEELRTEISAIEKKLNSLNRKRELIETKISEKKSKELGLRTLQEQMASLKESMKQSSNEETIQKINSLLAEGQEAIEEKEKEISLLESEERNHVFKLLHMKEIDGFLKDDGIKTDIIRKYLPVMNKTINEYLSIMNFFTSFELDEEFNETIRSRYRDTFSYENFSDGEKQRINLALLFAWREISRLKNSVSTNLLVMDETLDSSLDGEGVDALVKIIGEVVSRGNINFFLISHKDDIESILPFDKVVHFKKVGNFCGIAKNK